MEHGAEVSGGCLCGAVRLRVSGTPLFSVICHCASCRRASGAPSVAWLGFKSTAVTIIAGDPRSYRSSTGVTRRFCALCGTALTYENAQRPGTIDVTTLSLDDPNAFPPTSEVWMSHRLSWEPVDRSRPQFAAGGE
jgi:hypothetical protein